MVEWRAVVGFEGEYEVSSDGQVRSIDRVRHYLANGKERKMRIRGRLRTQTDSWDGYKEVHLQQSDENKSYYARVHRLVAEAFIPNPNNLPQVNHIDGNKMNNCVENLEWCTAKENTQHAIQKLHGCWMKDNTSSCLRIKCLDADIWFDSMLDAGKWAGGNSSNLIIAMKNNKPYRGHVFLRESELDVLDVPESEYIKQIMSGYSGPGQSFSYRIVGSNGETFESQAKFASAYHLDQGDLSSKFKKFNDTIVVDGITFMRKRKS